MKNVAIYLILLLLCITNCFATDYQYDSRNGFVFAWQADDAIGIYTSSGTLIKHWATDVDDNGGTSRFSSYGWSLASEYSYFVYSPFNNTYDKENCDLTSLPISYEGQQQVANKDLSGLAAYDYMMGKGKTTTQEAGFTMNHAGAMLRIVYKPKTTTTFTKITLCSETQDFISEAMMNLQAQTIVPTDMTDGVSLKLNNITVGKGDSLVAYMMVAPVDLSGKNLNLRLYYDKGNADDSISMTAEAGQLKAGHLYGINTTSAAVADHNDGTMAKGTLTDPVVTAASYIADSESIITPTGVDNITTYRKDNDKDTYTVSGIRVNSLQSGSVYIYKGKKIISK